MQCRKASCLASTSERVSKPEHRQHITYRPQLKLSSGGVSRHRSCPSHNYTTRHLVFIAHSSIVHTQQGPKCTAKRIGTHLNKHGANSFTQLPCQLTYRQITLWQWPIKRPIGSTDKTKPISMPIVCRERGACGANCAAKGAKSKQQMN